MGWRCVKDYQTILSQVCNVDHRILIYDVSQGTHQHVFLFRTSLSLVYPTHGHYHYLTGKTEPNVSSIQKSSNAVIQVVTVCQRWIGLQV